MADKPKVDIAMLFGKPKGKDAGGMGEDYKALAQTIFDDTLDADTRGEALHEFIKMCNDEESGEGPQTAGEEATEAEGY